MSSNWNETSWDETGWTGTETADVPDSADPTGGVPTGQEVPLRTLSRPKGPSWGTVALGLVCLAIAGGALFIELTDVVLDWSNFGPLSLVGLGVLLVLVGLAALLRRSNDDEDPPRH